MTLLKITSVVVTLALLSSCTGTKIALYMGPTLNLTETTISELSFDTIYLTSKLDSSPDNDPSTQILSNKYFLVIANDTIQSDNFDIAHNIAGGVTQINIPIHYNTLFSRFGSFGDRVEIPAQIHTETQSRPADKPNITNTRSSTFSVVNLPILQRPSVYIDTLMLKSFNLANAELEVRLRVVNPNATPIQVSGTQFNLIVDGTRWHNQSINQVFEVPVRSDIVINAPFEMRPRDFDTSVYRKLNMAQEFEYQITGSAQIQVTMTGFNEPLKLAFDLSESQQFERLNK
jgi:LEA14-like dessication related protein